MNRRHFLMSGLALGGVSPWGCSFTRPDARCSRLDTLGITAAGVTEIDAHCHVFNASDLQVRGFIRKIAAHDGSMSQELMDLVADFLEWLAQFAPDAPAELEVLNALRKDAILDQLEALRIRSDLRTLEETTRLLNSNPQLRLRTETYFLRARRPDDVRLNSQSEAARALSAGSLTPQLTREIFSTRGLSEIWEFLQPMLRYRASNCRALFGAYSCGGSGIDIFFPAMVDYDHWLGTGPTRSSLADQARVMRRIAQLLGMRVRPYLPFNPWSDIVDTGYFDRMTRLMADKEYIGFKIYPPMGFAPAGNIDLIESAQPPSWKLSGIAGFPKKLDLSMGRFLSWCASNGVPVMAHGNPSNGPDLNSALLGGPSNWAKALGAITGSPLHLSVGHFGGNSSDTAKWPDWSPAWADNMKRFSTLFADLSYWEGLLVGDGQASAQKLAGLLRQHPLLSGRLMFGTDWSMLAMEPRWEGYRDAFRKSLGPVFGKALPNVMGGNAKAFAGTRL